MRLPSLAYAALVALPQALGAYVQFKPCGDGGSISSLHAFLSPIKGNHSSTSHTPVGGGHSHSSITPIEDGLSRLHLQVFHDVPESTPCDQVNVDGLVASVELSTLGDSSRYPGTLTNSSCATSGKYVLLDWDYVIRQPHVLDSFELTVRVEDRKEVLSSCVNASLTPDIGAVSRGVATWVPVIVLCLVIIAALWREVVNRPGGDNEAGDEHLGSSHGHHHVIRVAECVSYLQFIFFSGALSVRYPGFLQPVITRLSWSTLMMPRGVVVRDSWYDGWADGIQVVNGTFGGTPGLEMATQIMGGTVTIDTWFNTVALSGLVLVFLACLVTLGHRLTKTQGLFRAGRSSAFPPGTRSGLRYGAWTVLRLFCSYLLMPLVAWSTYQLDHAEMNSLYHTLSAAAAICLLIGFVAWSLRQSKPHEMGYLLVDADEEEDQEPDDCEPQKRPQPAQLRNLYPTAVFILLFLRGSTYGGLQISGMVQVLLLLATEVVQAGVYMLAYRASPLKSLSGISGVIRAAVLALEIVLLPKAVGHGTRMVIGYTILGIHAVVVVCVFLLPVIRELITLASGRSITLASFGRSSGSQPQVYSLRQIMKRPTHSLSDDADGSPSPHPTSLDSSKLQTPWAGYFRPPRPKSGFDARESTSVRRVSPSILEQPGWSQTSSSNGEEAPRLSSLEASDYKMDEPSMTLPVDATVDYSVREADKYYGRPRKLSFGSKDAPRSSGSGGSKGKLWLKDTLGGSQGQRSN